MTAEAIGATVGIIAVVLSVVGAAWKLSSRLTSIESSVTTVETVIKRELTPNRGSSLRDRVVRIEAWMWAHARPSDQHAFDEPDGRDER